MTENIEKFITLLRTDNNFKNQIENISLDNPDEVLNSVIRIAKDNGIELTAADFSAAISQFSNTDFEKMADGSIEFSELVKARKKLFNI